MKIAISAESTIDLDSAHLEKYDIHTLPFHVQKGDEEGFDFNFKNEDLFAYTLKTGVLCHTSACNIGELEEHFAKLFKMGYDRIIHFTISSGLSSGYNNAMAVKGDNPAIEVIDSHGTSGGIALQAIYASELRDAGYDFDEIIKKVYERRPYVQCSFQLDRLDFLYKGGRCSKLAMIGANILHLKPEIVCDKEGKFSVGKKFRGSTEKCMLDYVNDMVTIYPNLDKKLVFFDYSTMDPSIVKKCEERAKEAGFREIQTYQACPTNSYHAGPNVIGIHFYFDGEHPVNKKD
ncbi:MAG: DegV family EDD domain-containing protein [Bacilli bacterium]|jgi:DegV family protein with EDD domain|nr:DegV family EDD domain-containing protein [Bacilli bacterium]MCH4211013.1 DegV family EDD domain-containing protein [Bacilli bacterium]MCH4277471.1 DegV family EDD domain-containing protein [Bacilli bacterium]